MGKAAGSKQQWAYVVVRSPRFSQRRSCLLPAACCLRSREAGRVGRAEVVSKVRCGSLRNAARRTRPEIGRSSRIGEPGVFGSAAVRTGGAAHSGLSSLWPRAGSARQSLPKNSGPRGFMPREQCKRRSLRLAECRSRPTFSTSSSALRASGGRSDACRAGRCS